jgi:hypothetical protein
MLSWLKRRWWLVIAVAVISFGVFLSHYKMLQDRRRELEANTYPLDAKVDGLKLVVNGEGTFVIYQTGDRLKADAIGMCLVTADDNKKNPERLKSMNLADGMFPILVFFNHTGFDSTGVPVLIRRADTGKRVWPVGGKVSGERLRAAIASEHGWTGFYWNTKADHGKLVITDEEWEHTYLGMPKMPPKEDKEEEAKSASKTGVRGKIYRVGGNPAIVPLQVRLFVYKGQPALGSTPNLEPYDQRIVGSTVSNDKGSIPWLFLPACTP